MRAAGHLSGRGTVRLTPARVASGLRRRLRRWSARARAVLPRRQRTWQEVTTASAAAGPAGSIDITVPDTAHLRRWMSELGDEPPVRRLTVVVDDWRSPLPGWSGRLGPLSHVVGHRVVLPPGGRGRAEVSVELAEPVAAPLAVAAVLEVLEPARPLPLPTSPDLVVDGPLPGWLSPTTLHRPSTHRGPTNARRHDVVVSTAPPLREGADLAPVRVVAGVGGTVSPHRAIAVDAMSANPAGRHRYDGRLPAGVLRLADDDGPRWWVARTATDPTPIVAGRVGEPLDRRQRDVLANLSAITCDGVAGVPEAAFAAALAQLAMTGVLLHVPDLAPPVAELLDGELAGLLGRSLPADADTVDRELASIRQRRAALRGHATGFALAAALRNDYPSLSRLPTVTAVLLTRRPDRLAQVLSDLARQTYPELEVVIGLHGVESTPAMRSAVEAHPRPNQIVSIPPELRFGEALGAATRRALGTLVTKVDDDDRYGPEHVWDLVLARHYSGATVAGKGAEFVYLAPRDVTVRRAMASEVYDGYVAGGALLLARGDLESVGGWRPVERSVDRALLDRVLGAGGLVYRTHGFGYLYTRHDEGHTWSVSLDHFDRDAVRRWNGPPPYPEFAR